MDERINPLLSYEENYFNEKEITPFSDRLDTDLNQIKNHLDKIRFLKLLQLSIEKHILKIGERPVNLNQHTENQFEEGEFNKRHRKALKDADSSYSEKKPKKKKKITVEDKPFFRGL